MKNENRELSPEMRDELLSTVKMRFEMNMKRHEDVEWAIIEKRLLVNTSKLWSLNEMERTGGEPDIIGYDENCGEYL
jgi:KaiC/GvpD/RAD55 family RecA-like ATPase